MTILYFSAKRLTAFCALFLLMSGSVKSQSFIWAHQGSSQGYDYGNAITSDDSGNVYVSGQIEYSAAFDNGIVLNTNGKHDILAGKYDTNGDLKWAKHAGGNGGDVSWGVGVDAAHNSYHTGEFENTAGFDPGDSLTVMGANDIFFSKYSSGGDFLWAKQFGGTGDDKGKAIAVDPSGTCYLTGYFSGTGHFDAINLTSTGSSNDIYVVKTDANGTVLWAKKAGGSREDRGRGIAYDASGNVYVTGTITQSAVFSGTTLSVTGLNSMFIAKYDANGNFQWVRGAGGCCDTTRGNAIAVDELGNAYVAGYYKNDADFDTSHLAAVGSTDNFLAKYDTNGNLMWVRSSGGPYEDMAYACTFDTIKEIAYMTGQLDDHGYFGTTYVGAAGNRDVFIAAYDTAGNVNWARPAGGVQRDAGLSITYDQLGSIYTAGFFNDTAFFGPDTLRGYPLADFFVGKSSPAIATQPTVNSSALNASVVNCNDVQLSFSPGNGVGRVVIAKAGSAVSALPVDGNYYTASATFGAGSDLGSGNYVVYNGSGSSVTVTGLTLGVNYYFAVIEYNGLGYAANYLNIGYPSATIVANSFTITATANSNSICAGSSTVLHASGAATYLWSPASGLSSTTNANPTASPSVTTTYTLTGYNGSSCQAQTTITITVNPLPAVTFPNLSSVCTNSSPVTLSGGTPAGGAYSGTGVSGGVFNPSVSGAGQFVVTYSYTDGNGCSASDTSIMRVNTLPTVTLGAFSDVCSSTAPFALSGGSPTGGLYSGSGVSSGLFNPSVAGPGIVAITYSYTNANGCTNTSTSNIVVNPTPVVSLANFTAVCSNDPAFALSGGLPAGGTYSGAGVSAGNFEPSVAGAGSHTITYSYTTTAGCSNSATATILVNAAPNVTIGNFTPVCVNTTPFTLTGGSPSGGTYTGTGISSGMFYPAVAGVGTFNVLYTFTNANGCEASALTTITVNAAPTVTLATFSPICSNAAPLLLTGGLPAGGSYSGTSVSGGYFNPSIGQGTYTINYSYSSGGCVASASRPITVYPSPNVNLGSDSTVCANAIVTLSATGFSTVQWSNGSTASTLSVDSAGVGLGTKTISVIVTNAFGCQGADTVRITFDPCAGVPQQDPEHFGAYVYPNPFNNSFRIVSERPVSVRVSDVSGRILEQVDETEGLIETGSSFAPGTYFVEVIWEGRKKVFHLVKADR